MKLLPARAGLRPWPRCPVCGALGLVETQRGVFAEYEPHAEWCCRGQRLRRWLSMQVWGEEEHQPSLFAYDWRAEGRFPDPAEVDEKMDRELVRTGSLITR